MANNIIKINHIKVVKNNQKKPTIFINYNDNTQYKYLNQIPYNYELPLFENEEIKTDSKRYTQNRTKKLFEKQNEQKNELKEIQIEKKTRLTGNRANIQYFKKYTHFSHGIDYLTFQFSETIYKQIHNYLFSEITLNTSNTNYGITYLNTGELFTINKIKTGNGMAYTFSITHNTVSVPLFQFKEYDTATKEKYNVSGSLKLYGAYYRIEQVGSLDDILKDTIKQFTDEGIIIRIDYRYDFLDKRQIKMPVIKKILPHMRSNKKNKPWMTGDVLESWECGRRTNQTIFIRMYDKNIQLGNDLKGIFLYGDILEQDYKTFHRLEYQFGRKYTMGFLGKNLNELIQKIHSTTGLQPSGFTGNLYKPKNIVDLKNEIHRNRYIKVFKSMHDNLVNNGIDPNLIFQDNEPVTNEKIINQIGKSLELLGIKPEEHIKNIKNSIIEMYKKQTFELKQKLLKEEKESKEINKNIENNEFFLKQEFYKNNHF